MKSSEDLIKQLDEMALKAPHAALVIEFPGEMPVLYVWSGDPNRLRDVRTAIEVGGEPMGYVLLDHDEAEAIPLPGLEGEDWVRMRLESVIRKVVGQIKRGAE